MRKWTYLVAALLLGGATTTFTGCIDNEEPAGITELRGAKAELLRAKAAVQNAEAAFRTANAAYRQAEADYKAEKAAQEKLNTDYWAAKTADDKLDLEQKAAKRLEAFTASMYELQAATAQKKLAYEVAMAEVEVAMIGVKDNAYAVALDALINTEAFSYKQISYTIGADGTVTAGTPSTKNVNGLKGLATELGNAQANLAKLMREKAELEFAINPDALVKAVGAQVAAQEATIKGLENSLAALKLVSGTPLADWTARYDEISAKVKDLDNKIAALDLAKAEEMKPYDQQAEELDAKKNAQSEFTFAIPANIQNGFYGIVDGKKAALGSTPNNYDAILKFAVADKDGEYSFPNGFSLSLTVGDKSTILGELNTAITAKADKTPEEIAGLQAALKIAEKNVAIYEPVYNTDFAAWQAAAKKYYEAYDAGNYGTDKSARDVVMALYKTYTDETDATKKDAAKTAFIAGYKTYLTGRTAIDGFKPATAIDIVADAAKITAFDAEGNENSKFGTATPTETTNDGYYKALSEAATKLGYAADRRTEITYKDWEDVTGGTNLIANGSSAHNYFTAKSDYADALEDTYVEDWVALLATVEGMQEKIAADLNDIQLAEAELTKAVNAVNEKYIAQDAQYDIEQAELKKLADWMEDATETAANQGTTGYDTAIKNINDAIAAIEGATVNQGSITVGTLVEAQNELQVLQKLQEALKSGDYEPELNAQIALKEAEINGKKLEIESLNALFTKASAKKDQLLAGLTGAAAE